MISRGFAIRSAHLFFNRARKTGTLCRSLLEGFSSVIISPFAAVAQLDRVLGYEPRGRGFNSCRPHQYKKQQNQRVSATSASPFFFLAPLHLDTFWTFFARDSTIRVQSDLYSRCHLQTESKPLAFLMNTLSMKTSSFLRWSSRKVH